MEDVDVCDDDRRIQRPDSFAADATYTEEDIVSEKNELYGPAPEGAQIRRGSRQAQTVKEVRLINGELILECKIPTILYGFFASER